MFHVFIVFHFLTSKSLFRAQITISSGVFSADCIWNFKPACFVCYVPHENTHCYWKCHLEVQRALRRRWSRAEAALWGDPHDTVGSGRFRKVLAGSAARHSWAPQPLWWYLGETDLIKGKNTRKERDNEKQSEGQPGEHLDVCVGRQWCSRNQGRNLAGFFKHWFPRQISAQRNLSQIYT